jgi:xanthine dehydrogenase YagR molybdenum-binding subunit
MKQLTERYTGRAKVTGQAKFAYEFSTPFNKQDLLYAFIVQSTIPNGSWSRC